MDNPFSTAKGCDFCSRIIPELFLTAKQAKKLQQG
jgi:hypothetical protein